MAQDRLGRYIEQVVAPRIYYDSYRRAVDKGISADVGKVTPAKKTVQEMGRKKRMKKGK